MVVTAGVVGELLMEVVLQRLNVGSPPVFRLDSEPSRMHVHDPKETSAVDLADDSNADKDETALAVLVLAAAVTRHFDCRFGG